MHIMRKLSKLHEEAYDVKQKKLKDKAAKKILQIMPKVIKAAEAGEEYFTFHSTFFDSVSDSVIYAMIPLLREQGFKADYHTSHHSTNVYLKISGWTDSQWSKDENA